jgi:hypothetical protein
VTWRECAWEDLAENGLPTEVRAWQNDDDGRDDATWQAQLARIPEVEPPKDVVMKYAVLEYASRPDGAVEL